MFTFNTMNRKLLIAKLDAYGFSADALEDRYTLQDR